MKGLVGLNIVVEKIYLMMRSCSFFHGVWAPLKPYSLVILGDTRGFFCKEENISFMIALRGKMKLQYDILFRIWYSPL